MNMKHLQFCRIKLPLFVMLLATALSLVALPAFAATAAEIDKEVALALEKLYAGSPTAREFSKVAKGVLVFPDVIKAGLVVGGQYGEGALLVNGQTSGYYNTVAASYGLQAG